MPKTKIRPIVFSRQKPTAGQTAIPTGQLVKFNPEDLKQSRLYPLVYDVNPAVNPLQIRTENGLLILRQISPNDGTLQQNYEIYQFDEENNYWPKVEGDNIQAKLNNFYNTEDFDFAKWDKGWIAPKDITQAARDILGIHKDSTGKELIGDDIQFASDPAGIPLGSKTAQALSPRTRQLLQSIRQNNGVKKEELKKLAQSHFAEPLADAGIDGFCDPIISAGADKNKMIFQRLLTDDYSSTYNFLAGVIDKHQNDFALKLDANGDIPREAKLAAFNMTRNPSDNNIKAFLKHTTAQGKPSRYISFKNAINEDNETRKTSFIDSVTAAKDGTTLPIKNGRNFLNQASQQANDFALAYFEKGYITPNEHQNLWRKRLALKDKSNEIKDAISYLANLAPGVDRDALIFDLHTLQEKFEKIVELSYDIKSDQQAFIIFAKDKNSKEHTETITHDIQELLKTSGERFTTDPKKYAHATIDYNKLPKNNELNGRLMIDNTNPDKMRESMKQTIEPFVENIGAHKDFHLRHDDPELIAYAFGKLVDAGVKTKNIHVPKNFITPVILALDPKTLSSFTPDEMKEWSELLRTNVRNRNKLNPTDYNFSDNQTEALEEPTLISRITRTCGAR